MMQENEVFVQGSAAGLLLFIYAAHRFLPVEHGIEFGRVTSFPLNLTLI